MSFARPSSLTADPLSLPLPRGFALAQRYHCFRHEVFTEGSAGGVAEPSTLLGWEEPQDEITLQSRWFAGEFGSRFTSEDGREVLVRDFGVWNHAAGPDFLGASVVIDGQATTGDVELDPDVRDWERHLHGANEAYQRVVLHVFLKAPAEARFFTRDASHRGIEQVRLRPEMLTDPTARPKRLAEARLGRCALPLREMEEARVGSLIEAAAQFRLARKSRRLGQWADAHGREQAVFQALARTLGYKANATPFLLLAQRLPVRRLLALDAAEREALLFGVAGWLDAVPYDEQADDTRAYLRNLWASWWRQRAAHTRWLAGDAALRWSARATRPGNHPQRRLAALAALLREWRTLYRPLREAGAWQREAWLEALEALTHDYWSTHYTLLAKPAARPVAMIGGTRVQEMLANVVYPLLVPDRPALWAEYLELPAMLENDQVRRAALRLFGAGTPLAKAFARKLHHQQGLLQLYEDFCLVDDTACAECPFPERITQWAL